MNYSKFIKGLLTLFFSSLILVSSGQNRLCGTYEMIEHLEHEHKASLSSQKVLNSQKIQNTSFVIPVVFHVIHNPGYGPENVSKAQIEDALRIANEDFQKLNSDTSSVIPAFSNIVGNASVEFRLARKDPAGVCTEGITRTASTLTQSANDNVKNLIKWDPASYLNIWVVQSIVTPGGGRPGGYAYKPTSPNWDDHGIVILASQLGSIGSSNGSNFATRTLTHELGHYFNLDHPWGPSNSPGQASNCSVDDGVFDTPNTIGVSLQNCNLSQSSCNTLDNVQNFMDYSSCGRMFTSGQVQRMANALNSSQGYRNLLWQPANLIETGTNDGYIPPDCDPIAMFQESKTQGCVGLTVNYSNKTYNADTSAMSFQWAFPGGTPSSSTQVSPTVTYNNSGSFDVSLIAINGTEQDTLVLNDLILVFPNISSNTAPIVDGFENSNFPSFAGTNDNYQVIDPVGTLADWQSVTVASKTGMSSLAISGYSLPENEIFSLITPTFNFTNTNSSDISMDMAYALRDINGPYDELIISASRDCGESWIQIRKISGLFLRTTQNTYNTPFVPNSNEWLNRTYDLSGFTGETNLRIKFDFLSMSGQNLFIDNINIGGKILDFENFNTRQNSLKVYPTIVNSYLTIEGDLNNESIIKISDISGRQVLSQKLTSSNVLNRFDLSSLSKGTYFIHITRKNNTKKFKIIKE